jgi:hypothetical protein
VLQRRGDEERAESLERQDIIEVAG